MSREDIWDSHAELAELRSNIYGFLSMVYSREPTMELIEYLSDGELNEALRDIGVEFDDVFETEDPDALLQTLTFEYTYLFLGPGPQHIPPFESVHALAAKGGSPQIGPLLGKQAFRVRDFYRKFGYEPLKAFKDSPDHVGVELGFMRLLTQYEKEAWKQKKKEVALEWLETEVKFLNEHLASWVPLFCDKASARAQLAFYKSLTRVTKSYVESEIESLPPFVFEAKGVN